MSRSAIRVILVILMAVILVAGSFGAFCWWKIGKLKEELVRGLGNAIGAQVEVGSLDLDLWKGELRAAGISLTNDRPSAPWEKGSIGQATVRFNLVDAFSPTLPLSIDVSAWNLVLTPSTTSSSAAPSSSAAVESNASSSSSQERIQVTQLSAHDGSVEDDLADSRQIMFQGVAFQASSNSAGVWTTELQASSIKAGSLEANASSVQIRSEQDTIAFSNLRLTCGDGFITGEGDASLTDAHEINATLKATAVPVTMLVGVEWQMKLSGQVNGNLTYTGSDQAGLAKGQLSMDHAKFNILPWLGKVTALVSLPDITDVEVDKATTDFTWQDRKLSLTNIDVRKNDVMRIAGTADIDAASNVDGKLKLGLPSSVISKWPQLQDKVFSAQLEDYNWADVHLTGAPDHLQEDLSPRLLAVGMQQSSGLLDQATQKASDLWKSFMGK